LRHSRQCTTRAKYIKHLILGIFAGIDEAAGAANVKNSDTPSKTGRHEFANLTLVPLGKQPAARHHRC
jgi:hypothetical protein